jgi:hypothetical protein
LGVIGLFGIIFLLISTNRPSFSGLSNINLGLILFIVLPTAFLVGYDIIPTLSKYVRKQPSKFL